MRMMKPNSPVGTTPAPEASQQSSVSILCQHQELPDGTMCQMSHDVDASKLLKMLQT
jgi:hypothetical protein